LTCRMVIKDVCCIDAGDIEGHDWLFHCASTVDNYNIHSDPLVDATTNCLGTLAVINACRTCGSPIRIVNVSTFFVNGNLKELPATADSPCNPLGLYGATKLAAEHFCRIYHNVFGLNSLTARMVNVFGPGEQRDNNQKAALNRMINTALHGGTLSVYGESSLRDILYIDDAVDGLIVLMKRGCPGMTYYVGTGVGVKIGAFAEAVVEEAGAGAIKYTEVPPFHSVTGIESFWCDPSPLMSLGWKPRISVRDGIRHTIAAYRASNG